MGKGNGGTRSQGPAQAAGGRTAPRAEYTPPSSSEYIPVTDRGMNDLQRAYITAFEERRRNARLEYGLSVDKDGNIIAEKKGSSKAIRWEPGTIPKDGVLTHVHPISRRAEDMGMFFKSVGKSFSGEDIRTAIKRDLAEIRAVTPNYTFSMRRPASGWNVDPDVFMNYYKSSRRAILRGLKKYADAGGDIKTIKQRYGRLNVAVEHRTMDAVAKRFGFIYTHSRKNK